MDERKQWATNVKCWSVSGCIERYRKPWISKRAQDLFAYFLIGCFVGFCVGVIVASA
jgi:hypothetical protein